MDGQPPGEFAHELRRLRIAAGLTQEDLAARSQVSVHSISNFERGLSYAPRPETLRLLAAALDLTPLEAPAFYQTARGTDHAKLAPPHPAPLFPHAPTPLIGREREIAVICQMLDQTQLLTIVGPGGVGKTRLAYAVAAHLQTSLRILCLELTTLPEALDLEQSLIKALGIPALDASAAHDALIATLQATPHLALLDNCETHRAAAPILAALLAACPSLRILATSRIAWNLRGEQLFSLHPLALPANTASVQEIATAAAVTLFVQRIQAVAPEFHVNAHNALLVAAICRKLDGLPLAIELAAPHLRVLSLPTLLAKLEQPLGLLAEGPSDLPQRHHSLRLTLFSSYALLAEGARAVFRQIGIFAGSCSLAAIEHVCQQADRSAEDVYAHIKTLVDHHLLVREAPQWDMAEDPRFRMLEVIRAFARDLLQQGAEQPAALARMTAFYLAFAETAMPRLQQSEQAIWLDRLETDLPNLRVALAFTVQTKDGAAGLRLASALKFFWVRRGFPQEGRAWLTNLLALASDASMVRVRALLALGFIALNQHDYAFAQAYAEEALALCQQMGNESGAADALNSLGGIARFQDKATEAAHAFEQSLALYRKLDERNGIASLLSNLAALAWTAGDYARAQELCEEGLAIFTQLGNLAPAAIALEGLGMIAEARGDLLLAERRYQESLAIGRQIKDYRRISNSLNCLADMYLQQGKTAAARAVLDESFQITNDYHDQIGAASVLCTLGNLAVLEDDCAQAYACYCAALECYIVLHVRRDCADCLDGLAQVFAHLATVAEMNEAALLVAAAAETIIQDTGGSRARQAQAKVDALLAHLRQRIDDQAYAALWERGAALPLKDVFALIQRQKLV